MLLVSQTMTIQKKCWTYKLICKGNIKFINEIKKKKNYDNFYNMLLIFIPMLKKINLF